MGEIPLSELARRCATEFSTKELCRLTDAQHQEYLRLLSALKTLNASHASDTKKGAILEELTFTEIFIQKLTKSTNSSY